MAIESFVFFVPRVFILILVGSTSFIAKFISSLEGFVKSNSKKNNRAIVQELEKYEAK